MAGADWVGDKWPVPTAAGWGVNEVDYSEGRGRAVNSVGTMLNGS